MKLKFALFTTMLLFARGCDFYSTSLWFFQADGMSNETNPLTRFFGMGWNGLLIVNIMLVGAIIAMYFYYCFRYKPAKTGIGTPKNFLEYTSSLYYGEPHKFYQVFYKIPINKAAMLAHLGYVLVRVVLIGSVLATIHNLSQYYNLDFYNTFRTIVVRPLFVIYGIIILSFILIYFRLLQDELDGYRASKSKREMNA